MQRMSKQIIRCSLQIRASLLFVGLLTCTPATAEPQVSTAPDSSSADSLMQQVQDIVSPCDGTTMIHFHMTQRCTDCVVIESYVRDVIERDFAAEFAAGRLALRLINLDLPEHRPLLEHYEIDGTTVILTRWHAGAEIERRILWGVWDFVEDGLSLAAYLGDEIVTALEADQELTRSTIPKE